MKKPAREDNEGFTRSISLYWGWMRQQRVQNGSARLCNKQQLELQCEHWLEAADAKHRYGSNLRHYFDVWLSQQVGARCAASSRQALVPYSAVPEIAAQAAGHGQGAAQAQQAAAAAAPHRSRSAPNLADMSTLEEGGTEQQQQPQQPQQHAEEAPGAAAGHAAEQTADSSNSGVAARSPPRAAAAAAWAADAPVSSSRGAAPLQSVGSAIMDSPAAPLPGIHTADRFFFWLEEGAGRHVDLHERGVPRSKLESERVTYLTPAERDQLEVTVAPETGLLVFRVSGQLVHTGSELSLVPLRPAAVSGANGVAQPEQRAAGAGSLPPLPQRQLSRNRSSGSGAAAAAAARLGHIPESLAAEEQQWQPQSQQEQQQEQERQQQPQAAEDEELDEDESNQEDEDSEGEQQQAVASETACGSEQEERQQRRQQKAALRQLQADIWQQPAKAAAQHQAPVPAQQQQQQPPWQGETAAAPRPQQPGHAAAGEPGRDVAMADADSCPAGADAARPANWASAMAVGEAVLPAAAYASPCKAACCAAPPAGTPAVPATPTAAAYGAVAGHATPGTTGMSQRQRSPPPAAAGGAAGGFAGALAAIAASTEAGAAAGCHGGSADAVMTEQQAAPERTQQSQPQSQSQSQQPLTPAAAPANGLCGLQERIREKASKWIYVLDRDGRLFVHAKHRGKFHHSSFLQGGAVMSAGGIVVEHGRILKLTADSGHYRPNFENFMRTVQLLKERGADLSATKLSAKHIKCPPLPDG